MAGKKLKDALQKIDRERLYQPQEALELLKTKGVTVIECDNEAFRKRVAPQTDSFVKARPESKPVVDMIRATQA